MVAARASLLLGYRIPRGAASHDGMRAPSEHHDTVFCR